MLKAFRTYTHQQRLGNVKVGCLLVIFLMPAGSLLDWFVYKSMVTPFFFLRLATSAVEGIIFGLLLTSIGKRGVRLFGVVVPLIPTVFIAVMIAVTEGFDCPYYAGLNLVLLAVGAVLHWTVW